MALPVSKFLQEGHYVDYTPSGADCTGGTIVVQGEMVGLADIDIAEDALGALRTDGVWRVPKTAGTGEELTAGAIVYWDAGNVVVTTTASAHMILGNVVTAASASDTTVDVLRVNQLTP